MGSITTLPEAGIEFRGSDFSIQEGTSSIGKNFTIGEHKDKALNYGLKIECNHLIFRQFIPKEAHKPRPSLIQKALNRVFQLKNKLFYNRFERLQAKILVMQVILYYTDLCTFSLGFPTENGFKPLTVDKIAEHAGLGLKRTKRALKELIAEGYIEVTHRWKKLADGTYCGLAAIRKVTTKFFTDIGIKYESLQLERHRAIKRREMKGRVHVAKPKTRKQHRERLKTAKKFMASLKNIFKKPPDN